MCARVCERAYVCVCVRARSSCVAVVVVVAATDNRCDNSMAHSSIDQWEQMVMARIFRVSIDGGNLENSCHLLPSQKLDNRIWRSPHPLLMIGGEGRE